MVRLETGELVSEEKEDTIIEEIIDIFRKYNLSVACAKHLLNQAKDMVEKTKIT